MNNIHQQLIDTLSNIKTQGYVTDQDIEWLIETTGQLLTSRKACANEFDGDCDSLHENIRALKKSLLPPMVDV